MNRDYEQLCVSLLSNEIENDEPHAKFSASKRPNYQGIKYPVTYVQQFKMAITPMSLTQGKKDDMMCKLFATTLLDGAHKFFNNLAPHTVTFFS